MDKKWKIIITAAVDCGYSRKLCNKTLRKSKVYWFADKFHFQSQGQGQGQGLDFVPLVPVVGGDEGGAGSWAPEPS